MIEKICIILLANLLFFLKTLGYKYSSDDIPASKRPHNPVKWKHWWHVIDCAERHSPQVDHALTMLFHAIVCVLIYTGLGANNASFCAALLFMVNPINNQGSVWIAGRGYVFPAIGMLLTLTFPFLAPLTLLGTTYYNHGFTTPIALIGSPHAWVVCFLPFCWLFHWKRMKKNVFIKAKMEMFTEDKTFGWHKIILATKTFGYYLAHSLIPFKTTFYHSFLQSAAGSGKDKAYTWKDRWFFVGVISIVAIAVRLTLSPWDAINFGLLWFSIGIFPFCNLFRIHQEIAERYCYLPAIGLMLALSTTLQGYPVAAAAFIAMYATKLWFYMDCYQDDYYLVEQACLHSPDSWFAWHVRAIKRWDAKSHQEATIFWVMARRISPKEFKILFNLATVCAMSNQKKEALEFIKTAEENIPRGQEEFANNLLRDWHSGKFGIIL